MSYEIYSQVLAFRAARFSAGRSLQSYADFFVYVPAGTSWVISKALLRGLETPFLRPLPLPLPLFGGDVLPMAKSTVVSTVR
jgi:hypothetical protein